MRRLAWDAAFSADYPFLPRADHFHGEAYAAFPTIRHFVLFHYSTPDRDFQVFWLKKRANTGMTAQSGCFSPVFPQNAQSVLCHMHFFFGFPHCIEIRNTADIVRIHFYFSFPAPRHRIRLSLEGAPVLPANGSKTGYGKSLRQTSVSPLTIRSAYATIIPTKQVGITGGISCTTASP